uniref:DUF1795 domain-containing protein n=1 Tax=Candidatus Nitrotoga fabula TaxID=2182327 RepID=A0A2X0QXI5_9PROT|nr:conserved exported protein of unknown function [Candidatus Nitrotoga fabula]
MIIKKIKIVFSALCFCLLALVALSVAAQSIGYSKLNVKGRIQLEVPSGWTINDTEQRKRQAEFAEKVTGVAAEYVASLSVQSYPAPSRVFVRVSFIPMEPPLTQAEVLQEVRANKQQALRDLADVWRVEAPTMWAGIARLGIKEVGRPSFAVESIGGQTALIIRYGRTSTANSAETMRVTQYHVPLGAEKVLITLSYIEGDQQAIAAHNRLKSSIVIR